MAEVPPQRGNEKDPRIGWEGSERWGHVRILAFGRGLGGRKVFRAYMSALCWAGWTHVGCPTTELTQGNEPVWLVGGQQAWTGQLWKLASPVGTRAHWLAAEDGAEGRLKTAPKELPRFRSCYVSSSLSSADVQPYFTSQLHGKGLPRHRAQLATGPRWKHLSEGRNSHCWDLAWAGALRLWLGTCRLHHRPQAHRAPLLVKWYNEMKEIPCSWYL